MQSVASAFKLKFMLRGAVPRHVSQGKSLYSNWVKLVGNW